MRIDGVDAFLAPDRIFEPILIPKPPPHRLWHRIQTDRVSGAHEGQQVAVRSACPVEYRTCPGGVIHGPIVIAGNQQQRRRDAAQTLGAPRGQRAAAGGRNRHDRAQSLDVQRVAQRAAARVRQHQAPRHPLDRTALRVESRARRRQHAIAAHGVADQSRTLRIHEVIR
jgi:hypothetical protein